MDELKLIDAACLCMPDGSNFWWQPKDPQAFVSDSKKIIAAWRASKLVDVLKRYDEAGVLGGVVHLRMPAGDLELVQHTPAQWYILAAAGVA